MFRVIRILIWKKSNLLSSQPHTSQVAYSNKIKYVTPISVKPKLSTLSDFNINTHIEKKLEILYTLWKVPQVVKNMLNRFIHHDHNVKPFNDDTSKEDLCAVLINNFINKSGFSTENDVFKTLDLLP